MTSIVEISDTKRRIESLSPEEQASEWKSQLFQRVNQKKEHRKKNLAALEDFDDPDTFITGDAKVKRCTAFTKKLKMFSESQSETLMKELDQLCLTQYISEVVQSLIDVKLRMQDVPSFIALCSSLHCKYEPFSKQLLESWKKNCLLKRDDKIANISKCKVDLRLIGELTAVGIFPDKDGLTLLASQLKLIAEKPSPATLALLLGFAKYLGFEFMNVIPRKWKQRFDEFNVVVERFDIFKPIVQDGCRKLLMDYFTGLCKLLNNEGDKIKVLEQRSYQLLQTKGEVSHDLQQSLENSKADLDKLYQSIVEFSDYLNVDCPSLPDISPQLEEEPQEGDQAVSLVRFDRDSKFGAFEDEEQYEFYCVLPDLMSTLPAVTFSGGKGDKSKGDQTQKNEDTKETAIVGPREDDSNGKASKDDVTEDNKDLASKENDEEDEDVDMPEVTENVADQIEKEIADEDLREDNEEAAEGGKDSTSSASLPHTSNRKLFQDFVTNVTTSKSITKDGIDAAAVEFCLNFNSKNNRKRLAKSMFLVHRTRYDLLPFLGRLTTILAACHPEIGTDLNNMLRMDFFYHVKKKDQIKIESKMKAVRFIGEMTKFGVFPKTEALRMMGVLLRDFAHHNINMCCALMESCGRFLFLTEESHHKMRYHLETMMRKKQHSVLEPMYITMIENAFFTVNPPQTEELRARVKLPPYQMFINRVLQQCFRRREVDKACKYLRKLDWNDREVGDFVVETLSECWNYTFNRLYCLAELISAISEYYPEVGCRVIDNMVEEIRLAIESPNPRLNQRRVAVGSFLGELYNYEVCDTYLVLHTLYSLITIGVSFDINNPSIFDPPENVIRIHVICAILDSCGAFFDRGTYLKKMDIFLIYFQHYYMFKRSHPIFNLTADSQNSGVDVHGANTATTTESVLTRDKRPVSHSHTRFPLAVANAFFDTISVLRPKFKFATTYDEARQRMVDLEMEHRKEFEDKYVTNKTNNTIVEEDEEDEETTRRTMTNDDRMTNEKQQGEMNVMRGEEEGDEDDRDIDENDDEEQGEEDNDDESDSTLKNSSDNDCDGERAEDDDDDDDFYDYEEEEQTNSANVQDDEFAREYDQLISGMNTMTGLTSVFGTTAAATNAPSSSVDQLPSVTKLKSTVVPKMAADASAASSSNSNAVRFAWVTKSGRKTAVGAEIVVPSSARLADQYLQTLKKEEDEKEQMKRAVLSQHMRQEEEAEQEQRRVGPETSTNASPSTASSPYAMGNQAGRHDFQHQRGVPDNISQIFGTNRRR